MANYIVLGAQWGDEGKGKIVDLIAGYMDMVVRFQGGANAGHTVIINDDEYVLHLIPGGIVSGKAVNIIGNGCVVDPLIFDKERRYLKDKGIPVAPDKLIVSDQAHIVTPMHRHLDKIMNKKIGTTGRGIGPAYVDKVQRTGIRAGDILNGAYEQIFNEQIRYYQRMSECIFEEPFIDINEIKTQFATAADKIKPFIADTVNVIAEAAVRHQNILYEGAQGTMLDVDHGSYPFVTSSSTTIGGAFTGSGVFMDFDKRIGVVKAYTTRVGEGPFPTELHDTTGEQLRKNGHEFGATTGRPRRCGWLDLKALKRSFINNGFNYISLSKISCLSGFDQVKAAVDYDAAGKPVYETFDGWQQPIEGLKKEEDLPGNARAYIDFIESYLKVPVGMISTGPARDHIIIRDFLW
ncbi:MAG: adenylosuccinate synthase [Caldithrix sp.]|nr:adenylosuccinate synthase [Caldithrix sp.]